MDRREALITMFGALGLALHVPQAATDGTMKACLRSDKYTLLLPLTEKATCSVTAALTQNIFTGIPELPPHSSRLCFGGPIVGSMYAQNFIYAKHSLVDYVGERPPLRLSVLLPNNTENHICTLDHALLVNLKIVPTEQQNASTYFEYLEFVGNWRETLESLAAYRRHLESHCES